MPPACQARNLGHRFAAEAQTFQIWTGGDAVDVADPRCIAFVFPSRVKGWSVNNASKQCESTDMWLNKLQNKRPKHLSFGPEYHIGSPLSYDLKWLSSISRIRSDIRCWGWQGQHRTPVRVRISHVQLAVSRTGRHSTLRRFLACSVSSFILSPIPVCCSMESPTI